MLHRKGSSNAPPIIKLGSNQQLVLSFDELANLSGQFRITFTHHNQYWENSNLPDDWFIDGINELIIGGGEKNALHEPDYFHYDIEFPNNQINFKISGNYMLHVSDFSSGTELFSLPFFVTEEAGTMTSRVETIYNAGPGGAPIDQPFSVLTNPDFVEFPQFDLTFFFVQNRFWGQTRETDIFDISRKGETGFHLSRHRSYAANFDFNGLRLNNFTQGGQIIEWLPGLTPPKAVLREDILNFSSDPVPSWNSTFGLPESDRNSRYANVRFRFADGGQFNTSQGVYLVGDFNQWLLSDKHKLEYNPNSGYWETTALIKEGSYTYKYAIKSGRDGVDDLTLSDSITRRTQEYVSLVYFHDPAYRYYRLIQADVFYSTDQ